MRELIENLEISNHVEYLLDTCFLIYCLENGRSAELVHFCREHKVGMSSFNLAELEHIHNRFPGPINHHMRNMLKSGAICRVPVDVYPGDRELELNYVNNVDRHVPVIVHDPSDAVLIAIAIEKRAKILTRDKHHLFTVEVENHLKQYGIEVSNELR